MFRDANGFPITKFEENCGLRQIYEHQSLCQIEPIVFITLQVFFQHTVETLRTAS